MEYLKQKKWKRTFHILTGKLKLARRHWQLQGYSNAKTKQQQQIHRT